MTKDMSFVSRAKWLLYTTAAVVSPACAQEANQSSQVKQPQVATLGEIVVTAQRRDERLEDVPISVDAIDGDTLDRTGVVRLEDVERLSPGVRISRNGVYINPAIRGITSSLVGAGQENNTAIYVDGFYQPELLTLGGDFANVSNVQILKGPQGTLYGRNAMAGAMLITTRDPTIGSVAADADISYGSRDDVRARAYLSVPLGQQAALGVGGYLHHNDGYIRDTSGVNSAPYKNDEVRVKLLVEPANNFTLTLGYNHLERDDVRALAYSIHAYQYLRGIPLPPVGPLRAVDRDVNSQDPIPQANYKNDEASIKAIFETGPAVITSLTNWQWGDGVTVTDSDATKIDLTTGTAPQSRDTFSQAIDVTIDPGPGLQLSIGGFYFNSTGRIDVFASSMDVLIQSSISTLKTESLAGYAEATWEVVPRLFLTGGVRYSTDKKTIAARYTQRLASLGGPGTLAPATSKRYSDPTFRAVVRYELTPESNVYASFSQGFKSGTFNSTAFNTAALTTPVKPEKADAFEVGYKLGRNGFNFSTAAYYYDYANLQVSTIVANPDTGSITNLIRNAASAEIYGAEASVTWNIDPSFELRLGGAYTHARYKSFPDASVNIPVNGIIDTSATQDLSGRRIARAPDWTFNASVLKTIDIGRSSLDLSGSVSYTSAYAPQSEAFDPATGRSLYYQDGYVTGSVLATLHLPGDRVSIGGFIENVGNKRFKIVSLAGTYGAYDVYSEPRRFGVKLGVKY
ncbi:TonB-dependent receptor [Novosphingobium pentaromativorans]|uniref:TonB-dependent receptor n=1 Tax=Novosphingobium pentaromativorans US6-1 TaxID=1088721 RepID=G6E822_9SPHN|nr:TonB-dependent receptor [Novosphingobium pentaromativorans]AIT81466.1 hypothetical protein JI59_17630 [Novosphingobium pentaromativorans US6-1]EHJ62665.1 hypothetical protein NSU_0493 [Novosphingobium pentaromativorans US6-1]